MEEEGEEILQEADSSGEPEQEWRVSDAEAGQRLDLFVTAHLPDSTRTEAQRLIEMLPERPEGVLVNGRRMKPNYRMRPGDRVIVRRPMPAGIEVRPESIPLEIVYEDADLLVINKARGMVVHPAPGSERGTLVNAVLAHATDLSGIGGELRPGIVHRLDRDTGGLIMVAKNDLSHRSLQQQIQERTAERRYLALVWGVPTFDHALVEAPIGRHPTDRKKMAVITDTRHTSREARTELTRRAVYSDVFSLWEAKLQTGRTHQIRVHCAYIHHPIVGDPLYGGLRKLPPNRYSSATYAAIEQALQNLNGQALHAYSLAFQHPRTGERLSFSVSLPHPMQALLDCLQES